MQEINDCKEPSNNLYLYNTIPIPQIQGTSEKEPVAQDTREIMPPRYGMATTTMEFQQHGKQKVHIDHICYKSI